MAAPTGSGAVRRKKRSAWRRWWRRLRWPLAGFGVLAVAVILDLGFRYLPAVRALQHGRDQVVQAQALLTGDIEHLDHARLQRAGAMIEDAGQDFGARSAVIQDGWLAGIAAHVPWFGGQVEGARALRTTGGAGLRVGGEVVSLVDQLLPSAQNASAPLLQRLVGVAANQKAALAQLSDDLATLKTDVANLPNDHLIGTLDSARQTLRTQAGKLLETAVPAIAVLDALPAAIGPGQHTYLLLLQNPGEERPGGGYIGAVGQVTFKDGAVTDQSFRDSAFTTPIVRNIPAPRAFNIYLQHNAPWEMGDAAWSPDFPTSAQDVERFYTVATGVHPDGVIAVDPVALSGIIRVLGNVTVPPYPQVIIAANALQEINYIANFARPGDPGKVYLAPLGQTLVNDLLHAGVGQSPALASSLAQSAQQKHVMLFFHNADLQRLVSGAHFDGAVAAPLSDSLQVVDANLSGSKADLYVTRHFSLVAKVGADGQVHDTLTLTYHDPVQTNPADAHLMLGSGGDYRDYLQVIIPETGQLDSLAVSLNDAAPTAVAPESVAYDFHRQEIAYYLIVPRGGSATVTLTYEGPFADISQSPERYALIWAKQDGALTWPIDVTVSMPGHPDRHWSSDLAVDREWSVSAS